jgi:putative nucleotidyltransferase with HDIG domain
LEKLRSRGFTTLYVADSSRENYQTYLRNLLSKDRLAGDVPNSARVGAMCEIVRDVLNVSFRSGNADRIVDTAIDIGGSAADMISDVELTKNELFGILHHDYATFTHSTNVAMYAGLLAKELRLRDDEIKAIVVGGLLHDIGKLEVTNSILCKPDRLDEREFAEVMKHTTIGLRKVAHRTDLNVGQLMMVYQHHERVDGRGYPVGVPGGEIHEWAKICAVVDIFEAITSYRPYRKPMPFASVIELLRGLSGKAFDEEILECWVNLIQNNSLSKSTA